MAYHQSPYESTTQNPWTQDEPRFGNAYENNNNYNNNLHGGIPLDTSYPAPHIESNKTEYMQTPSPAQHSNPYQYTGTRLGEYDNYGNGNAYSSISSHSPHPSQQQTQTTDSALPPPWKDHKDAHPSKWRLLLRVILLVAAVGHLGFAAGASPRSGLPPPLTASGCFYYLYAVAVMTILYSLYHIGYYVFRRFAHGMKTNRPVMMAVDLILALMWGVGVIVEAVRYKCPPGQYNGWCDFYNVSIFFGFVCFAGFLVAFAWDVVGACVAQRRSSPSSAP